MSGDPIAREADAWAAFALAVTAVPLEQREEPDLPDGWSVKDVMWHIVHWWRDGVSSFLAMHAGTYVESETTDAETDATNARVLEESRSMPLADVESAVVRARNALLEAFASVVTEPAAVELFESETIEHYEEHIGAVRALVPAS